MKVYSTKVRELSLAYWEIPYTEYREDGSIKRKGIEDFSAQRYNELNRYNVRAYTGEISPSGSKLTHVIGCFLLNKGDSPSKAARLIYGDRVARVDRI